MKKLTLDVETLTVESLVAGPADEACPAASATAATSPL
jgi:hypothetical protein